MTGNTRHPDRGTERAHQHRVRRCRRGGVPVGEEARAFLTWIDQFELLLRSRDRFPTPRHRDQVLEQINAARDVHARMVRDAKE
jgi:hypothetical protein